MMTRQPDGPWESARRAAEAMVEGFGTSPEVVVVLGSGWQPAAEVLGEPLAEMDVGTLAGFVRPGAAEHGSTVRLVEVHRGAGMPAVRAAVFLGRPHLFEGHDPDVVAHPVRSALIAGAKVVVLTNAAGTLSEDHRVGSAVLVSDQLNLTGCSPLVGAEPPAPHAGRFVDMTDLYTPELRELARAVDPSLAEDVYAGLLGPQFETPAEIRAYRSLGAGVLGFSTVIEAIAARHLGAEVLGISLVTNLCAGMQPTVDAGEVLAIGREASPGLGELVAGVLARLPVSATTRG
jgi:purine-nucleoside phosphorylase